MSKIATASLWEVELEAGIPFSSLQNSHSVYGKADFQHELISQVVECVKPKDKHQISIYDNFTKSPGLKIYFPQNSGIIAPETPVSIFQSLIMRFRVLIPGLFLI